MVFAIVASILAVLIPYLWHIDNSNREAHEQIGENVKESKKELDESIEKFEKRITDSVKADVDRIYNLINTLIPMIGKKKED